jgi:hypothetical protein
VRLVIDISILHYSRQGMERKGKDKKSKERKGKNLRSCH